MAEHAPMVDLAQVGHIHIDNGQPVASQLPMKPYTFELSPEQIERAQKPCGWIGGNGLDDTEYKAYGERERERARKRLKFAMPYMEIRFFQANCMSDTEPFEIRHATDPASIKSCAAMLEVMQRATECSNATPHSVEPSPPVRLTSAPPSDSE